MVEPLLLETTPFAALDPVEPLFDLSLGELDLELGVVKATNVSEGFGFIRLGLLCLVCWTRRATFLLNGLAGRFLFGIPATFERLTFSLAFTNP
jgi:hypothetical protein